MDHIKLFIEKLSQRAHRRQAHNPYRNPDLADNLYHYLVEVQRHCERPVLLVGEAPGYKGARLTGIPFSCGGLYDRFEHPFLKGLKPKLKLTSDESENTAIMVWQYLTKIN